METLWEVGAVDLKAGVEVVQLMGGCCAIKLSLSLLPCESCVRVRHMHLQSLEAELDSANKHLVKETSQEGSSYTHMSMHSDNLSIGDNAASRFQVLYC